MRWASNGHGTYNEFWTILGVGMVMRFTKDGERIDGGWNDGEY